MARAKEILCPYCFTRWSTSAAAFRCTSTDATRCARVPDEKLGRLRGVSPPPAEPRVLDKRGRLGQAFAVKPGNPVRCECGAATRPVCPACHSTLPQRFTEADARTMALIGTRASGKSHYIPVALHELEHRVGPKFGGSLMLLDDATRHRVERELLPRLYGEQIVLVATASAASQGSALREPLVSRLTLGRDKHATHSNLVFFDAAGEDLESLGVLEREARYVTQSDGLILLIDPLQIAAVRDELDGERDLPPVTMDPYTMLGRLSALMHEARAIPANKPIDVPLAIALSKVDMLRGVLPEDHPLFRASANGRAFDADAARNLSEQLRADVAGWLGERFDTFVKAEFPQAAYFGLSALGENPVHGYLRNGVAPLRVEDPILWMLHTWGAIPKS